MTEWAIKEKQRGRGKGVVQAFNTAARDAIASEGWFDKALARIAPVTASRRRRARITNNLMASAYDSTSGRRGLKNWTLSSGDADFDTLNDLGTLRRQARKLERTNSIAAGYIHRRNINVVGTGILPQAWPDKEALGLTDEAARKYEIQADRLWARWVPHADFYNELDFNQIQSLVERRITVDGDVIVLRSYSDFPANRSLGLALQVIESDRLQSPHNHDTANIRGGVEKDDQGRVIAYHLADVHPGDTLKFSGKTHTERIPAYDKYGRRTVFHLKHIIRPNQSRGITALASIITKLKELENYDEAELVRARVAACFAAFIYSEDPQRSYVGRTDDTDSSGAGVDTLEPGMIEHLLPNEKVTFGQPAAQGATYDAFIERNLRTIAAGLGISYESMMSDFNDVNYSSARTILLEDRQFYKFLQQFLIRKFCQPVRDLLLEEAFLTGQLTGVRDFYADPDPWTRAMWTPPGWSWVDPVKEGQAAQLRIQNGISTLAIESAAVGGDWEANLEQIAREMKKAKKLGITLPGYQDPERISSNTGDKDDGK